jgi:APA family basic amino acid/polyamine antiporter
MSLFRTKSIASLQAEATAEHGYKRTLGPISLISLGIGSVVGAGIFVTAGQSAAQYAGPAIALSFIFAGISCLFAGLCYAELASMIPVSGSAYTYSYATLGEFLAWTVGWCLVLEYLFSGAAVAVGWSGTVRDIFKEFDVTIPLALSSAPLAVKEGGLVFTGAIVNFPAVFISLALTYVLYRGIKESASVNDLMVFIKVGILVAIIGYGVWYLLQNSAVAKANLVPFIPENNGPSIRLFDESGSFTFFGDVWNFFHSDQFGAHGWSGVFRGAAAIFFAYVGFDCVSAAAQETKNPQRDMPIGLLGTLGVVTVLFVAVSLVPRPFSAI